MKLQTQRPFYPRTQAGIERDAGIIALHLLALDIYNIDSMDKSSLSSLFGAFSLFLPGDCCLALSENKKPWSQQILVLMDPARSCNCSLCARAFWFAAAKTGSTAPLLCGNCNRVACVGGLLVSCPYKGTSKCEFISFHERRPWRYFLQQVHLFGLSREWFQRVVSTNSWCE